MRGTVTNRMEINRLLLIKEQEKGNLIPIELAFH